MTKIEPPPSSFPALSPEESRWSVADCLTKLADAADHLLRDHDCDAHGWEQVGSARDAARRHAARLSSVQEQTGERTCDCETLRVRLTELREERLAIAKLFDIEPCYDDTPHSWSCGDRGNVSLLALLASRLPSPETAGMFAQRELSGDEAFYEHLRAARTTPQDAAPGGEPSRESLRDVLAWHHLTGIECNHEAKTDVATCGCAVWRSEPMPSVGAALEAWADHVLAALDGARAFSPVEEPTSLIARSLATEPAGTLNSELKVGGEPAGDVPCVGCGELTAAVSMHANSRPEARHDRLSGQ